MEEIFGPEGLDILRSGDEVADREDGLRVKEMILQKIAFDEVAVDRKIPLLGDESWPFPIPLVLRDGRWRFDVEAGADELLTRRIGRNELLALASLHAYVDAQRDYASQAPDGTPPTYARRLLSTEGKHDGLYWPAAEGEPESPLGPYYAEAADQRSPNAEGPQPFNGYYFRMLEAQGKSAPGGARSYVDEQGLMTRGHALVAWPAEHGSSGIQTFQISAQGVVFQKDLGPDTASAVESITVYEPDDSWEPTGD